MHNKNTLGKSGYVWASICWFSLLLLFYRILLFCPILALEYSLSTIVLTGTGIAGSVIGAILTYKRRRNYVSIFCNSVLSFGPYYIVSFWSITRSSLVIAGVVTSVLILLYCFIVLIGYIATKKDHSFKTTKATAWQWLSSCFLSCRTLVSIVLAILILSSGLKTMLGFPVLEFKADSTEAEVSDANSDGETIAKNMDTVLLLQEDEWYKLDTAAKLKVMKTITDIEANYLGIDKMNVCTELLDRDTLGQYDDSTKTITLNLSYLSTADARIMLSTLCHECYHSYQHRLVDLYNQMNEENKALLLFRNASYYTDEFSSYIDGSKNYEGYIMQQCEIDSDEYADEAVIDYYYHIYQYSNKMSGENTE